MSISRRELIGGSVALAALGVLGGCSPSKGASGEAESGDELITAPADREMETDIVVLGSGMAGLAASIEACEQGSSVVLLEKEGALGGNTAVAEGVFGVGSRLQKELGITVDVQDILTQEFEFHHYNLNTRLWETIANNSAQDIDWLMDHGVEFKTVTTPAVGPKCWHVFKDSHGFEAVNTLAAAAEDLGTQIMQSTPGISLLMDGDRVVGVRAQDAEDSLIDIRAKAVVLATGGMAASDEELIKRTCAESGKFCYLGVEGPTGDGLKMAEQAGMGKAGRITVCNIGINVEDLGFFNQFGVCMGMEPTNLWVNEDGVRFFPESSTFLMTTAGNAIMNQHKAFSIIDQASFDRLMAEGPILGQETATVAGQPCQDLKDNVDKALDRGNRNVFVADTLEELAEQMEIDPDTLIETVDEYNGFCDAGADPVYNKSPEYLVKVSVGPFYGARLATNVLSTFGGVRVNKNMEVIKAEDGAPIPGLYAAGIDCSGFQGDTYGIIIAGSTQGVALGGGRIAGSNATAFARA